MPTTYPPVKNKNTQSYSVARIQDTWRILIGGVTIWILFSSDENNFFTKERSEWVKYCFHHEKITFISSSRCVIFFLLYREALARHFQPFKAGNGVTKYATRVPDAVSWENARHISQWNIRVYIIKCGKGSSFALYKSKTGISKTSHFTQLRSCRGGHDSKTRPVLQFI